MNNLIMKQFFKKMKQTFVHRSLLEQKKVYSDKIEKDPGKFYYLEADKFAKKSLRNTVFKKKLIYFLSLDFWCCNDDPLS